MAALVPIVVPLLHAALEITARGVVRIPVGVIQLFEAAILGVNIVGGIVLLQSAVMVMFLLRVR